MNIRTVEWLAFTIGTIFISGCVFHRIIERSPDCRSVITSLSDKPQCSLHLIDRSLGFITTPFKRMGVSGWGETGCIVRNAKGELVRDAQHSTDGFWTIDVKIASIEIEGVSTQPPVNTKYIRLELLPGTVAHLIASRERPKAGAKIEFGGPVMVDDDGPFLEVHPNTKFTIESINKSSDQPCCY